MEIDTELTLRVTQLGNGYRPVQPEEEEQPDLPGHALYKNVNRFGIDKNWIRLERRRQEHSPGKVHTGLLQTVNSEGFDYR